MVIVFSYKGRMGKELLREEVMRRYNELRGSTMDVRLYYDKDVPMLTENKYVSITHTYHEDGDRLEQIAISDEMVGIDIECMYRDVDIKIASRCFDKDEVEYIGDDKSKLIELWEKKEAYLKAHHGDVFSGNMLAIDNFKIYELYKGYKTVIYTKSKDIMFVAM